MFGIQHFHDHFKLAKEIDSSTERKNEREKDKDEKNTGLIGFARFPPGVPPFHIRQAAGHGARLVSRHVDKLKRLGSIGGKEEESNNFEPSSCSTDYDAVTPFQQKSISTANSPCEQNLLDLSLSLSQRFRALFSVVAQKERGRRHTIG